MAGTGNASLVQRKLGHDESLGIIIRFGLQRTTVFLARVQDIRQKTLQIYYHYCRN